MRTGCRPRKRKALMLTLVSQIVGQNHYEFKIKQIIKYARIFRGTKSLNFEIFLYTVSIRRKIPSGVIAPPVKRVSGRYQSPTAARLQ